MHPLKFISQTFNIPLAQIAEHLGIKRQSVNEWVGKRQKPIPKKHIPRLAELFKISEEWFEKQELKPSEKIEIQRIKLARDVTHVEYEDYFVDDEGNVHEVTRSFSPEAEVDEFLRQEQRVEKVLEDVEHMLKGLPERGDEFLRLFESILTILDTEDYPKKKMLFDTVEFLVNYHLYQFGFWTDKEKEPLYIKLLEKYEK